MSMSATYIYGRMNGWVVGSWTDGWVGGWTDGGVNGQTDGQAIRTGQTISNC